MLKNVTHITSIDIVTTSNQEILNSIGFPSDWTYKSIRRIDLKTDKDCIFLVNNTDTIKVKTEYGLSISYEDLDITSLIAITSGVALYALVGY